MDPLLGRADGGRVDSSGGWLSPEPMDGGTRIRIGFAGVGVVGALAALAFAGFGYVIVGSCDIGGAGGCFTIARVLTVIAAVAAFIYAILWVGLDTRRSAAVGLGS